MEYEKWIFMNKLKKGFCADLATLIILQIRPVCFYILLVCLLHTAKSLLPPNIFVFVHSIFKYIIGLALICTNLNLIYNIYLIKKYKIEYWVIYSYAILQIALTVCVFSAFSYFD